MKTKAIKGQLRKETGSSPANKNRRKGLIPCVLYGGKGGNINFYGFINDFRDVVFTPLAYKVTLVIDDKEYLAVVQDVQFHPLSDEILHIDFYQVTEDKEIKTHLPIDFQGTPEGTKEGGRFFGKTRSLKIKGKVKDIPEKLVIDVTKLKMGDNLKVSTLNLEGLEILNSPNVTVASVLKPKGLKKLLGEEEEVAVAEGEEGAEGAEGAAPEGEDNATEGKTE